MEPGNQIPVQKVEQLNKDDKAAFDQAEQKILDEHRERVGRRMARTLLNYSWSALPSSSLHGGDSVGLRETGSNEADGGEAENSGEIDLDDEVYEEFDYHGMRAGMIISKDKTEEALGSFETEEEAEKSVDQVESAMRTLIRENASKSAKEYFEIEREECENLMQLKFAQHDARTQRRGQGDSSSRTRLTDYIMDLRDEMSARREKLENQSPEAFTVVNGYEFRKRVREISDGGIAVTPYVERHLDTLQANMEKGIPSFIRGHLGSGKTELAIMAAKKAAVSRAAYQDALDELWQHHSNNPDSSEGDNLAVLSRAYRKSVMRYNNALKNGDKAANERFSPLIISGSKDLTSQEMYSDKSLKVKSAGDLSLTEHREALDKEFRKWADANPDDAEDPTKAREEANRILELYKMGNGAFGTEVETIKKEIYRGVEEGRPVIIDEANAIPMAVLISLNDILQRRPGQKCSIPGVGSVRIKPGFSLTLTGNISSNIVDYGGTNDLNPAFLSRFHSMEHDYLPMSSEDPNYDEQANPRRNELFQVMIAGLCNRTGDLEIPEPDKSLKKLFRLAQFAHDTQLVFSGKWQESKVNLKSNSSDDMEPSLEKSVLSTRNILNVLREWDKGSEKDLDKALWDGFIEGIENPNDKNYALAMAKQRGFFQESDGWNIRPKEPGSSATTWEEAHPGEYYYERTPVETMDLRQVVEVLYGKGPEREIYPDIDLDELEDEVDVEPTDEDFEKAYEKISEVESAIRALERLSEQCGCSVAANKSEA